MPRVLIGFVDRIVRVFGHCFRIAPQGPPKVRHKAIEVVDSLSGRRVGAIQEHRAGAKERLHVVLDVPKPLPDQMGHARFSAEPREGRFKQLAEHRSRDSVRKSNRPIRAKSSSASWDIEADCCVANIDSDCRDENTERPCSFHCGS